ncbi:MAG: slipin family protein [Vampirovibrionales bacterium]
MQGYFGVIELVWLIITIILLIVSVIKLSKRLPKTVTIFDYETGLLYKQGVFQKELGAGSYKEWPGVTVIEKLDLRLTTVTIKSQEILTNDNIALKISALCIYKIVNPKRAKQQSQSYQEALYAHVQLLLRDYVTRHSVETLLANKPQLNEYLQQQLPTIAEQHGLIIDTITIKDITFPSELKKLFAEVVRAKQEGLASLERARGEAATLRSLTNTANLVEDKPMLMKLRVLQAFSESGQNNSLVLHLSDEPK